MQAGRALQAGRPACGGKAPAKNPAGGGLQQEKETQAGLDGSACGGRLQQEKNIKDFCPFIAITGTNGKSTTTALLAHILRRAGYNVQMGGNIGRPVLELAPFALSAKQVYVVEISSYQIDLTPSLNPTIGVVLNITPDHIDRHGSFRAYAALKERLAVQSETAIIAYDDAPCQAIYDRLKQAGKRVIGVGAAADESGIINPQDCFTVPRFYAWHLGRFRRGDKVLPASAALRGRHNGQNALCALAAAYVLGAKGFEKGLADFKGLPHRMEEIGQILYQGVIIRFINDSKATNAESVAPALQSYNNIYWLAGGRAKKGGINSLLQPEYLAQMRRAYFFGEAAVEFGKSFATHSLFGGQSFVADLYPYRPAENLIAALALAWGDVKADIAAGKIARGAEAVILLAPACASFDQFKNFEERGKAFAALAEQYSGGGRSK
ncbi:UDP-N-acetylmuramoyl-L-alanine--D-glutamate ligase [Candidatus Tokpelaia sp.]|uniref:UDP-N-acetylmuramoyl-L-alanine--D-glutamate ligase n=1 Tax=Candidatus Tokpelaia sp. TaxID=2233777 RepID=UPI001FEDD380|nr:UDP-N-acetylmuramoyl-L-alanine--D-glutamate ligase [Candidatus Tokpelaia sp.]